MGIEILENPVIEAVTIFISLAIGGLAVWRGYIRYHHSLRTLVLFVTGLFTMIISNFVEITAWEMVLKISGGVCLVTAHIQNWRNCRKCNLYNCENNVNM